MSQHTNDDLVKNLIALGLLDADGRGHIGVLKETVDFDAFTDLTSTLGTYQMAGAIPKGSIVLGSKVRVITGFTGDTSAVLTIGEAVGSDVDRFMTGTPSVFTTAAAGIQSGIPSGEKLLESALRPTLHVTSGSDFTLVTAGSLEVSLYYIRTQD